MSWACKAEEEGATATPHRKDTEALREALRDGDTRHHSNPIPNIGDNTRAFACAEVDARHRRCQKERGDLAHSPAYWKVAMPGVQQALRVESQRAGALVRFYFFSTGQE